MGDFENYIIIIIIIIIIKRSVNKPFFSQIEREI